jgi:cytochrome c-type biogenesis protein CcmH/NrfG
MDQSRLVGAVEELTAEVSALSERATTTQRIVAQLEAQRKGMHTTRLILSGAIVLLVVVLGVTVGGVLLYRQMDANQREIRQVQQRTSAEILCPLYEVFATSIKANPPNPNLTPAQAKVRQDAADTILAGLDKLGCA